MKKHAAILAPKFHAVLDALDQEIGDADASTVGGWVMEQTENIPKPGDSFQWEKWRFDVLKTDGRHVMEIQATALPAAEA